MEEEKWMKVAKLDSVEDKSVEEQYENMPQRKAKC